MTQEVQKQPEPFNGKAILTKLATKIVARGMSVPAIFFFEMVRPLNFIGAQAMNFFGPFITTFVRSDHFYEFTELMEERENLEFFILEIERLEAEGKSKEKKTGTGTEKKQEKTD